MKRPHGNTTLQPQQSLEISMVSRGQSLWIPRHQTETEQHQHGKRSRKYSRSRGEFSMPNDTKWKLKYVCNVNFKLLEGFVTLMTHLVGGVLNPDNIHIYSGTGL